MYKPLTTGIWLKGLLQEKGITQARLSQLTGLSKMGINFIVNDKNNKVREATIINILRALFPDDNERFFRELDTFKILQNKQD
jgi:transcriptional regulator with XRE-family HTH domain